MFTPLDARLRRMLPPKMGGGIPHFAGWPVVFGAPTLMLRFGTMQVRRDPNGAGWSFLACDETGRVVYDLLILTSGRLDDLIRDCASQLGGVA